MYSKSTVLVATITHTTLYAFHPDLARSCKTTLCNRKPRGETAHTYIWMTYSISTSAHQPVLSVGALFNLTVDLDVLQKVFQVNQVQALQDGAW